MKNIPFISATSKNIIASIAGVVSPTSTRFLGLGRNRSGGNRRDSPLNMIKKFQNQPQSLTSSTSVIKSRINPSYRLSFTYQCNYDNDVVQMAYCVPYTYTQLT